MQQNRVRRKNNFIEESKILLNRDLKIILSDHWNNFVGWRFENNFIGPSK